MAEPDPVFDVRYPRTPQIGTIVAGTHDPATLASAILINDHGNVTLYTPNPEPARIGYAREIMTEVWSIV